MNHPDITTKQIKKDIESLSVEERKIYDSVMESFPATHHLTAMDVALQGGVRFQFICR